MEPTRTRIEELRQRLDRDLGRSQIDEAVEADEESSLSVVAQRRLDRAIERLALELEGLWQALEILADAIDAPD